MIGDSLIIVFIKRRKKGKKKELWERRRQRRQPAVGFIISVLIFIHLFKYKKDRSIKEKKEEKKTTDD